MSDFNNEEEYLTLLGDIVANGVETEDRTGIGTKRVIGRQVSFNLRENFPLMTTRKIAWKGVVSELLWFIEGSGDERRLAEIRYGKPREELTDKKTIWSANASAPYWIDKAQYKGDLGRVYGKQWRDWRVPLVSEDPAGVLNDRVDLETVDQLQNLIEGIKKNPTDRRHILTAWNPGELHLMALPPCHMTSIFSVVNEELYCHVLIRSWDCWLGAPFNIASYALFTLMIAQVCGLKPAELIISANDVHLYQNTFDQTQELLRRDVLSAPTVTLNPNITDITAFTMDDIYLHDYDPQSELKAEMAV